MEAIARACARRRRLAISVVRVIADRDSAGGLARATRAGHCRVSVVPRQAVPPTAPASRPRWRPSSTRAARELVVLAGFMRILSRGVRRSASRGGCSTSIRRCCPKYKGLRHARARARGRRREHGASVHFVTAELDGGPVILQGRLAVRPGDTPETVSARVHALEHIIYPHVDRWIAAGRLEWRDGRYWLDGAATRRATHRGKRCGCMSTSWSCAAGRRRSAAAVADGRIDLQPFAPPSASSGTA